MKRRPVLSDLFHRFFQFRNVILLGAICRVEARKRLPKSIFLFSAGTFPYIEEPPLKSPNRGREFSEVNRLTAPPPPSARRAQHVESACVRMNLNDG